jgi:hypothetical protein
MYKRNYERKTIIEIILDKLFSSGKNNLGQYRLRDCLITQAEKNFLEVLKESVGDKYYIELQVQISRIVEPTNSNYSDFNRIKAKSIDFVLYDKNYKPFLAIELDDSSHLKADRIDRDNFVDGVMNSVGLRIIHVPVSYHYDIEKLRNQIFI